MRRLEIGPGKNPLRGFESIDIVHRPGVDHVGDITKEMPFKDGTFDLVYASQVLEHVPWFATVDTLKEWVRIIRPGGRLEIWVPNALKVAMVIVQHEMKDKDISHLDGWYKFNPEKDVCKWAASRTFSYGSGKVDDLGHPDWHRAMFTPRYLKKVMVQAGLKNIEPLREYRTRKRAWIHLGMAGTK